MRTSALILCGFFAALVSGCGSEPEQVASEQPSRVDRLIQRLEEAEVHGGLVDPARWTTPGEPDWLLLDTFDEESLPHWRAVRAATKSMSAVAPETYRRTDNSVVFLRNDHYLARTVAIPPATTLLFEASLRPEPAAQPSGALVFLNEYRDPCDLASFALSVQADVLARLVPERVDEARDGDGYVTYRLAWRTTSRTGALLIVLSPAAAGKGQVGLKVKELRLCRPTPAQLASLIDASDPPDGARSSSTPQRCAVRVELDGRRADALAAPPPSRFRFPLSPPAGPRHLSLACALDLSRSTAPSGALTCRVRVETPGGDRVVGSQTLVPDTIQGERAWIEMNAWLPDDATHLVLETVAEGDDATGFVTAYLVDPIVVTPLPKPHRPNVVLISLDALRADRLSAYGYDRPTSPFVESLASSRAVTFEHAMAPAGYTLPSHVTMLSGQSPLVHTVRATWQRIDAGKTTLLAQILREHGYRTAGFTGGLLVNSHFGFERGFDRYFDRDPLVLDELSGIEQWLEASRHAPFFLFVHTYAIHNFVVPEELRERFHPGPCGSRLHGRDYYTWGRIRAGPNVTDEDRRHVSDMYDGAIAYADGFVAGLFECLESLGLLEQSIVVITSDHGKELLERGAVAHGHSLFEEVIHVPLLMCIPGVRPRRLEQVVGIADLTPTILDLLGIEPSGSVQGGSLVPLLSGGPFEARPIVADQINLPYQKLALREGRYKLLRYSVLEGYEGAGDEPLRLFDLEEDPGEQHDLQATSPHARELQAKLDAIMRHLNRVREALERDKAGDAPSPIPPALLEELKQAGYVR
ncbi:MAG: sulfatase [Planctomycetota bacterium]